MRHIILLILFFAININTQGQGKSMHEKWRDKPTKADYLGTPNPKHWFSEDGSYSFEMQHPHIAVPWISADGTYYYQQATNEIFVTISRFDERMKPSKHQEDFPRINKQYFKIVSETDSTIVVNAILFGDIDWYKDENGQYNLVDQSKLPLGIITYWREPKAESDQKK